MSEREIELWGHLIVVILMSAIIIFLLWVIDKGGVAEPTPTQADVIYTACQESGRYIYPDQRIIKCEVW